MAWHASYDGGGSATISAVNNSQSFRGLQRHRRLLVALVGLAAVGETDRLDGVKLLAGSAAALSVAPRVVLAADEPAATLADNPAPRFESPAQR